MAKILFGVDDVNPKRKADGMDFGGDLENGNLGLLGEFAKKWNAKITLFLVPSYEYKRQALPIKKVQKVAGIFNKNIACKLSAKGENFNILKYPQFCDFLKRNKFFDIQMHGYTHFHPLYFQEEFKGLQEEECTFRIKKSLGLFKEAGFERPVVFAPPGWHVSENLINSLKKNGFASIAGSIDDAEMLAVDSVLRGGGLKNVSSIQKEKVNGLTNIPRNFDLERGKKDKAVSIFKKNGILSVHAHIAPEGVANYITKERLERLGNLFSELESEGFKLEFSSFKDECGSNE